MPEPRQYGDTVEQAGQTSSNLNRSRPQVTSARADATGGSSLTYRQIGLEERFWHSVVMVSCDEGPYDFSVQLISSKEDLDTLNKNIGRLDLLKQLDPTEVTVGVSCLVASKDNNIIHRGVVLHRGLDKASVGLVDIGTVEFLEVNRIFKINSNQIQPPIFSHRCHLNQFPEVPATSKNLVKKRFETYKGRNLQLQVLPSSTGDSTQFNVNLIDDEGKVIANELKQWLTKRNPGPAGDKLRVSSKQNLSTVNANHLLLKQTIRNKKSSLDLNSSSSSSTHSIRKNQTLNAEEDEFGWKATASNSFGGTLCGNSQKAIKLTLSQEELDVVLGAGHINIKKIRKESNARIFVVGGPEDTSQHLVSIEGNSKEVEMARGMITRILQDHNVMRF